MLNILGKRYYFFALSLLIIVPGLILLVQRNPRSIDFKGGTLLEVKFTSALVPSTEQVKSIYDKPGVIDVQIQESEPIS